MRTKALCKLGLAATLAACVASPDDQPPLDDDAIDDGVPPEGGFGWAVIDGPSGRARVRYHVEHGLAMWDGDIALGPVAEVARARHGGAAHKTLGRRWPSGIVRYRFDASVGGTLQGQIGVVLDDLMAQTPLVFVDIGASTSGNYVEFRVDGFSSGSPAYADQIGMAGGEQGVVFHGNAGITWYENILHEVGHVVGLFHEQSRPDRDSYIEVDTDCIDWNLWPPDNPQAEFEIKGDALGLGPYDFQSIMHYGTGSSCKAAGDRPAKCNVSFDVNQNGTIGAGETKCATMLKLQPGGTPVTPFIGNTQVLSVEDNNTLWRLYAHELDTNLADEHLGAAMVSGDFDGDGYDDLAVGAPDEDWPGQANAGVVYLWKGTSNRLVPWGLVSQATVSATNQANDHFGAALAAGDVDGDGVVDLVVGVPDKDVVAGGVTRANAGAVAVFLGSPTGLVPQAGLWTQARYDAGVPDNGDRFGAALAIGPITNNGGNQIAIGAPGDRNTVMFIGTITSGAVFIYTDPAGLLLEPVPTRLPAIAGSSSDEFGASIAIGTLDGNANADLAIGAPGRNNGAGAVFVYRGNTPAGSADAWPTNAMATYAHGLTQVGATAGNRFGAALLIANVIGPSDQLVVGAPGTASAKGAAYLYGSNGSTLGSTPLGLAQTLTQDLAPSSSRDPGDQFGAAFAFGYTNDDPTAGELVVGAPGEDGDQGAITLFRGGLLSMSGVKTFKQGAFAGGLGQTGDRLGASLAFGDFNGSGEGVSTDQVTAGVARYVDLAVGVPGDAPEIFNANSIYTYGPFGAGSVYSLVGTVSGGLTPSRTYHQERVTVE